ncbi:asparagine--tRNA ligase [Thermofilum pendens]|uniref:Asparagine--tRNA ligase n=1 Tax=Thermofilum pendens (strain DSM 2475 / Hrk 5) TaxID=368408 RepID=A1RYG9_THEPD|nr:asparagine--tRNA ligase [Thermofilum pendens]ABL78249.1 asparaginyl-tRNA synthetase [Thermofilum pendens Hrk 5]
MSTAVKPIREALRLPAGSQVTVRGWVYRRRDLGDKAFVVVRDSTGIIQAVFTPESPGHALARKVTVESSVIVGGALREDPRAPGGKEIAGRNIEIVGLAENFPIRRDASREFLLEVRHLAVRSRKMTAVLKLRSTVFEALHEWFRSNGFYEVHCPMFISAAVEGGATLFPVKYVDGSTVYLTQSSQFYLEALIYSLEKVYTVAPSFRAEKSRTRRHLTEFWHAEAEVAWTGLEGILKVEEELVSHIVRRVLEKNREELELLGRNLEPLKNVEPPFPRISYDKAIEILQGKGLNVKWGDDLGADEERALTEEFDKPFFLYGFPVGVKAFYHKNDPSRPEVTLSADLLAPEGYGEIIGGGERIEKLEELLDKIKQFGLNPSDYEWYLDLRRYGTVPHAGFGLGMDRLVTWIAGLDHIVDSIPFPRTVTRTYP